MTHYEIAVIGGGIAGSAAADFAHWTTLSCVLIDPKRLKQPHAWLIDSRISGLLGTNTLGLWSKGTGVNWFSAPELKNLSETSVWGLYPGFQLALSPLTSEPMVTADVVIVATGATDLAASFSGSDLPGVMTGNGLIEMITRHHVWPGGRRVTLIGNSALAAEVSDVVRMNHGSIVGRIENASGVEGVPQNGVLAAVRSDGQEWETDIIALCLGSRPDIGLLSMMETEIGYSEHLGGFVPVRSECMETTVPKLFVCGGAAGNGSNEEFAHEGRLAGMAAGVAIGSFAESVLNEEIANFRARFPRRAAAARAIDTAWIQHDVSRSVATPIGEF